MNRMIKIKGLILSATVFLVMMSPNISAIAMTEIEEQRQPFVAEMMSPNISAIAMALVKGGI